MGCSGPRWIRATIFAIAGVLFLFRALPAQSGGSDLKIQVVDPSGASVAASGTLRSISPGAPRRFRTDPQGAYTFAGLPAGQYRLKISKPGFAPASLPVTVPAPAPITVTLQLASATSRIEVVSSTPLPGATMSIDQVPAPVQVASAAEIEATGALDLSDFMKQRLNGVNINENQENPYQPDVNYRGYTASPLLGTPEGISVYLDGVRQNQPFGDIVAWDLIPKIAIQEVALIPGSNPVFGLNTLGGAVSVQTKDGLSNSGTSLQVSGGSFGRRAAEFEHGGSNRKGWDWYAAGNLFREDGWRQDSPSEVRQAFGKLYRRSGHTSLGLSLGYADNWLTGDGLQDFRFLQQNYASVYSIPDITWDRAPSLTFSLRRQIASNLTLAGIAYFRYIRADTTNGDINSNSFDQQIYNLAPADVNALQAAGYSGFPTTGNSTTEPFPSWSCIAQALEKADPSDLCTGIVTDTYDKQHNYGGSVQASWTPSHQQLTVGAAWDRSGMTFQQGSQFGYLNPDGITVTPVDAFANGSTTSGGVPVDTRVFLHGTVATPSVYAVDAITKGNWTFTVSGRYNRTAIDNIDRLPLGAPGSRGSLNGDYAFGHFNPAAGFTWRATRLFSPYLSFSEASRAPTAIELGCANPAFPCNLPNALVSDPPLQQVVTRTVEAGLRGSLGENLHWTAGWFRGENYHDILFVASEQTGFGYFTNFGQTLRQGAEASANGRIGHLTLGGDYTFLNATYASSQVIDGGSNSANDAGPGLNGNITVLPGDRIPQIPQNIFKTYAEFEPTAKLSTELDFDAIGRSYARGNENNLYQPDGTYYLGQGYSPGYGVVNLAAHYQISKKLQVFVQVNNLLNHRYYTAAQVGPTPFDNAGNFVAQPFPAVDGQYPIRTTTFLAPGAPIGVWGGLRFRF